jgi:anthranilate/para-aminobenzoate synthase component II
MLSNAGASIRIVKPEQLKNYPVQDNQLVIFGPGTGNPNEMASLQDIAKKRLESKQPTMGICLGHQMLAKAKGYDVLQKSQATQ